MSINVEEVGGNLVVQHYVAEQQIRRAPPHGVAQRPANPRRLGQDPGDLELQRHRHRRGHLPAPTWRSVTPPSLRHARGGSARLRTGGREPPRGRHPAQSTRNPLLYAASIERNAMARITFLGASPAQARLDPLPSGGFRIPETPTFDYIVVGAREVQAARSPEAWIRRRRAPARGAPLRQADWQRRAARTPSASTREPCRP